MSFLDPGIPSGTAPVPPLPSGISFRARWAALSLCKDFAKFQTDVNNVPTKKADEYHLLPVASSLPRESSGIANDSGYNVCIIGAGVAGMFTALIFDYLKDTFNLNVKYEILEAEKESRVGGRLYTYKFPTRPGQPATGVHDYYDVGAMRFPDSTVMKRTFQLFINTLEMKYNPNPENNTPQPGDLIPYYFRGKNQPTLYNGIQVVQQAKVEDLRGVVYFPPLSAETFKIPNLPSGVQAQDAGDLAAGPIQWITDIYKEQGAAAFWEALKTKVDPFSTRQYYTTQAGYDYNTVEFMETVDFGTGWYDQAASETVLEAIDFDSGVPWWCVEGGASQIALRMKAKVNDQAAFSFEKLVTKISYTPGCGNTKVDVTTDGETQPKTYDAVFNSVTLGAMQHMQLEGLNLNWGTKLAIRNLGYSASCKVGVRFRNLWWKSNGLDITQGGVGKTDLPIHFCVYPSYNVNDANDQPGVLLVSYTWSQEAERIGALINRDSPANEKQLRALITHDLALLHAKTGDDADYQRLYQIIDEAWLDHFAYNWSENPRTAGAFAFFGPQQFTNLYNDLTASDGRYVIIGEASSAHHAWVVGALESAVRGVYQFLYMAQQNAPPDAPVTLAYNAYNSNDNVIPGPFGPLPEEFNRPSDVGLPPDAPKNLTVEEVGELARMGVLIEQIRLKQGGDVIDTSNISDDALAPIRDLLHRIGKLEA